MSVLSVSTSTVHTFNKQPTTYIYLLAGLGVQGDIHCSTTPSSSPRQVHIIDSSLFDTLSKPSSKYPSFELYPGDLGENITTQGVDLISLSEGTKLHFGDQYVSGKYFSSYSGLSQDESFPFKPFSLETSALETVPGATTSPAPRRRNC